MDNEMRRMQQEAIHRVNEMQARAKQKLHGTGDVKTEPVQETPPVVQESGTPDPAVSAALPAQTAPPETSLQGLFDALMQDQERTMILVLILLLFTEQADTAVIFALLYTVL